MLGLNLPSSDRHNHGSLGRNLLKLKVVAPTTTRNIIHCSCSIVDVWFMTYACWRLVRVVGQRVISTIQGGNLCQIGVLERAALHKVRGGLLRNPIYKSSRVAYHASSPNTQPNANQISHLPHRCACCTTSLGRLPLSCWDISFIFSSFQTPPPRSLEIARPTNREKDIPAAVGWFQHQFGNHDTEIITIVLTAPSGTEAYLNYLSGSKSAGAARFTDIVADHNVYFHLLFNASIESIVRTGPRVLGSK